MRVFPAFRVNKMKSAHDRISDLEKIPDTIYERGADIAGLDFSNSVAIVGSRRVSDRGLSAAYNLGKEMAENGRVVISGLALGIDSAAFEGALSSNGTCVAVLPSGLDTIVPLSNRSLAERIIKTGGSLISEYPEGTAPRKYTFIQRNRIIAALSDTVILCEARSEGGAWHTVKFAWSMGRKTLLLDEDGTKHTLDNPQRRLF